mmetsp:Transcript_61712/g.109919  ORF Transcript_61712/g.109919 Transcript_61712/m.109919 type:complete len:203 (-) Transcript_61712:755-1363(-)
MSKWAVGIDPSPFTLSPLIRHTSTLVQAAGSVIRTSSFHTGARASRMDVFLTTDPPWNFRYTSPDTSCKLHALTTRIITLMGWAGELPLCPLCSAESDGDGLVGGDPLMDDCGITKCGAPLGPKLPFCIRSDLLLPLSLKVVPLARDEPPPEGQVWTKESRMLGNWRFVTTVSTPVLCLLPHWVMNISRDDLRGPLLGTSLM